MSYILEALKKSEKKRQGEPSNLAHLATDETPAQEHSPPKRPLWPLLVGLALVINAGVMLLIFWSSQSTNPEVSTPDKARQQAREFNSAAVGDGGTESVVRNAAAPESERTEKPPRNEAQSPNDSADVAAVRINQAETTPAAAREEIQPRGQISSDVATTSIPTESALQSPANSAEERTQEVAPRAVPPETEAEPAPMRFSNLPPDYRRQLPEMHMSVHVYSEAPAGGLVRINNKMLRPGGNLEGSIRLEEITREGAVFSFAGRRFLLPRR